MVISPEERGKISALRIWLHDAEDLRKTPAEIVDEIRPTNHTHYAWIPQTMGEQIWVLFGFESEKERIDWENSVPTPKDSWVERGDLIERALEYGWYRRDINGRILKENSR